MTRGVRSEFWRPARLRRAKIAVLGIAAAIVIVHWVRVFDDFAQDDFRLHWSFGQRFVAGENLYRIGHTPYPPFWGMACAPLSFLPKRWAHVAAYPIGVVSLGILIYVLDRLTRRSLPVGREAWFWSTAAAVALSSRFVIRELPECGPNLLMVALAWGAIALWRQRPRWHRGSVLGAGDRAQVYPGLVRSVLRSQAAVENGRGDDDIHVGFFGGPTPPARSCALSATFESVGQQLLERPGLI